MKNKPQIVVQKRRDTTEYLLSSEANAKRLMESIEQYKCSCGAREVHKCSKENGLVTGKMCFK